MPGETEPKLISFKWNSLSASASQCGVVCVPPLLPFWGQGQLALIQSPVSPYLWGEEKEGEAGLRTASCFLLNYWLEFPLSARGTHYWALLSFLAVLCPIWRKRVTLITSLAENSAVEQVSDGLHSGEGGTMVPR